MADQRDLGKDYTKLHNRITPSKIEIHSTLKECLCARDRHHYSKADPRESIE